MATKYLRYADLVERQIVNNRTTLQRWIRDYGFPPGVLLGPNTRAWPVDQVDAWLAARAMTGEKKTDELEWQRLRLADYVLGEVEETARD